MTSKVWDEINIRYQNVNGETVKPFGNGQVISSHISHWM